MNPTFDAFVQANIPPEQHDIVRALRDLMRRCAPNVTEAVSYDMPVWNGSKHILAYINPNKNGITFSFVQGVLFEDKFGLLRGSAKWARFVRIKALKDINEEALCDYIRQALEHDDR